MLHIAVISNKPKSKMKILSSLETKKFIVSRSYGYGLARNDAAKFFGKKGLMVQFNDDLVLSPDIWNYLNSYQRGEFGFMVVDEWVCSRVFVIHLEDFWRIGGCDENIKYAFEDGDFYIRATQQGLRFKPIPSKLAKHISHPHSWWTMKNIAQIDFEWSQLFVKYKRKAKRNMFAFYFRPFHWKVLIQHFILKVIFTIYWIIRGTN